jgi:hypothetical protein
MCLDVSIDEVCVSLLGGGGFRGRGRVEVGGGIGVLCKCLHVYVVNGRCVFEGRVEGCAAHGSGRVQRCEAR